MSPWFQKSQEVINSMNYPCRVFIGKSAHSVWVAVFIAFAFLVIFNGPVEAFSFPEGEFPTYQGESNHPGSFEIGTGGTISHTQEIMTYGINQVIELSSSIPIDGKPITKKVSDKDSYESKCDALCETHCQLLINILCLLGGLTVTVLIRHFLL